MNHAIDVLERELAYLMRIRTKAPTITEMARRIDDIVRALAVLRDEPKP